MILPGVGAAVAGLCAKFSGAFARMAGDADWMFRSGDVVGSVVGCAAGVERVARSGEPTSRAHKHRNWINRLIFMTLPFLLVSYNSKSGERNRHACGPDPSGEARTFVRNGSAVAGTLGKRRRFLRDGRSKRRMTNAKCVGEVSAYSAGICVTLGKSGSLSLKHPTSTLPAMQRRKTYGLVRAHAGLFLTLPRGMRDPPRGLTREPCRNSR
jgi:hypothetical protein